MDFNGTFKKDLKGHPFTTKGSQITKFFGDSSTSEKV